MNKRKRSIGSLGPLLSVMLLALALSFAAIVLQLASHVSRGPFEAQGQMFIINLILLGIGIVVAVLLFFGILKGSMSFAVRIAVSLFVFSAVMSMLVYLKLFLSMTGSIPSPGLYVSLSVVAYLVGFLGVMAIFDVLPRVYRNLLFAVCCGILGAFIGGLTPTMAVVSILVIMSMIDIVLTRRGTIRRVKKPSDDYENLIILKMSYTTKEWAIGLGDLLCYSMLIANTFTSFGLLPSIAALILVTVGSVITLSQARRLTQVPGLPFAVGLGLIPTVVSILLPVVL